MVKSTKVRQAICLFLAVTFFVVGVVQYNDFADGKLLALSAYFPLSFLVSAIFLFLMFFQSRNKHLPDQSDVAPSNTDHAVIVHFNYGSTDLDPLFDVGEQFEKIFDNSEIGEFDGHEIAVDGSDGYLYFYGPDADMLFEAILPVLKAASSLKEVTIQKRYGPPGDDTRQVDIALVI